MERAGDRAGSRRQAPRTQRLPAHRHHDRLSTHRDPGAAERIAAIWAPALQSTAPDDASHRRERCHSASKTRVNALMASGERDLVSTLDIDNHPRGSSRPSFAVASPSNERGCREDRVPGWHPRSTVRRLRYKRLHSGIQVKPKHPAFPAQWVDGLCRDLPGERCTIAPVALRMADVHARLDIAHHHKAWRTGSGRQDHTILPYADHTGRLRGDLAHGRPPCKT